MESGSPFDESERLRFTWPKWSLKSLLAVMLLLAVVMAAGSRLFRPKENILPEGRAWGIVFAMSVPALVLAVLGGYQLITRWWHKEKSEDVWD